MKQFSNDVKVLIKNNWKIIPVIVFVYLISKNYTEIKSGLMDG